MKVPTKKQGNPTRISAMAERTMSLNESPYEKAGK